jgi:hypothetical protein
MERNRLMSVLKDHERALEEVLAEHTHIERELGNAEEIRTERDGLERAIAQTTREHRAVRDELVERELRAPGAWVRATFGERPDERWEREQWETGVGRVAAYRAKYEISDLSDASGPRPEQREQHHDWKQAREAIDRGERRLGRDVGLERGMGLDIGRDTKGRRLSRPPKPYEPPEAPAGKINLTDLDSRMLKASRGCTLATDGRRSAPRRPER